MGEAVEVGAFVRASLPPFKALGVGKLSQLVGHTAVVTYFNVPDDPHPIQATVPLKALQIVQLPEQTRVFRLTETIGHWQVGRVLDGADSPLLVQFPNSDAINVSRADLQTRWNRPIEDPVAFLRQQVTETPLFTRARSGFLQAVIRQRASSLGMSAVLSSCIQLTNYQFHVVRRVLEDPVQRYLLADEVGLGKTIEAGVLIRQYVLDASATARILVIVPAPLVKQWRRELVDRFALADLLDDYLHVVSSDNLQEIAKRITSVGMVVVDEAHHLSRLGTDGKNPLYDCIRQHTSRMPRLLLLSATPVLSDTIGFLRVLHLLDPVVFPLDDLAALERRLQSRQLVAEIAASLIPENVLSMEDDLDRLQSAFPEDATLGQLVAELRPIVQALPESDDQPFASALNSLWSHLTETYKLHRRILRNRRKSVSWATPRRIGMESVFFSCRHSAERYQALDQLRVQLFNTDAYVDIETDLFSAAVHPMSARSLEAILSAKDVRDATLLALARRVDVLSIEMRSNARRRQTAPAFVRPPVGQEHLCPGHR